MSTYLVTGAAGFIASKVCELLLADGHTVVGVDNLNDYYDIRLKDHRLGQLLSDDSWRANNDPKLSVYAKPGKLLKNGRFSFRFLDVEQLSLLDWLFSDYKFDAVFHLAARAGVRYSMENPYVYLYSNTLGTLNILECMRKHGVKKHVLASTSSLYAGCSMPFTEDRPVNEPRSPYAATKKAAEALSYTYHKLYELDTTILRYFTVYGPSGRPDMAPFRFVHWIATGQPIQLFGDGEQSRDFTYVDDIARGTILAAKPLGYEIVNLGGGNQPLTINSMISCLERNLGRKAVVNHLPVNSADMTDTQANIDKARRILGWSPSVSPEEGFKRTVESYRCNQEWLQTVRL